MSLVRQLLTSTGAPSAANLLLEPRDVDTNRRHEFWNLSAVHDLPHRGINFFECSYNSFPLRLRTTPSPFLISFLHHMREPDSLIQGTHKTAEIVRKYPADNDNDKESSFWIRDAETIAHEAAGEGKRASKDLETNGFICFPGADVLTVDISFNFMLISGNCLIVLHARLRE